MKASELRIGNYVDVINRNHEIHLPYGFIKKVGAIQFFKVELYEYDQNFALLPEPQLTDINDLSPIRITEEWLLKFGFERPKNSSMFYWVKLRASLLNINPENGLVWLNDATGETFKNPSLIQYVHQLQNLYFALTGEELILKA